MSFQQRWRKWFFRNTAPETAPIFLGRHRIYIVPTRTGLLYALVLITMYVGAINYNLGLGHALVFLLVGLGLVGMVHTYANLVGIGLSPGRCTPVFCDEQIAFRVVLHNGRTAPRFSINLQKNGPRAAPAHLARLDAPDQTVELHDKALQRGWHELGRLRIESRFPLGIFVAWSYPFPDARCLIYPRPIFLPLPVAQPSAQIGDDLGALGEEDFSGFRLRQPSDSPRHIAWKAYARDPEHQPLLVKTFAGGAQAELWLDWQLTPLHASFEDRLSILCGWCLQAEREGQRFGLRLPNGEFGPASGRHHLDTCLERLAVQPPGAT